MAKASDNPFPSLLLVPQTAVPLVAANPSADYAGIPSGYTRIFLDGGDGLLYAIDSSGLLTPLTSAISTHGISNESGGFLRNESGQLIQTGD